MSQPNKPAKAMSSRLANMKFMQRASTTPSSSPATPSEPPSKRQRLSNGMATSTPSSTPRSQTQTPANAGEGRENTDSVKRASLHQEETKWYLSIKESPSVAREAPLRIVSAGYSTLDSAPAAPPSSSAAEADDVEQLERPQLHGRKSFGKFNRRLEKQQKPDASSDDSSSSSDDDQDEDEEEDGEDSDDPTGAQSLIAQARKVAGDRARAERKAKRKVEKVEASRLADERRKKTVKLNNLTSISGGGGGTPSRPPRGRDMECFRCGGKGHMKADCPQALQQQQRYRHR